MSEVILTWNSFLPLKILLQMTITVNGYDKMKKLQKTTDIRVEKHSLGGWLGTFHIYMFQYEGGIINCSKCPKVVLTVAMGPSLRPVLSIMGQLWLVD